MDTKTTLSEFGIGSSAYHWFGRGFLAGLMITASANAISYFFRSEGILNLIGASSVQQEAIGIPFEVWRRGQAYGTFMVDFPSFYANCGLGVLFGILVGVAAVFKRTKLNNFTASAVQGEAKRKEESQSFQFSIKSMLIATSVIAIFLGIAINITVDPKVLAVVFFAGPAMLIGLSMLPPRLKWQHRVVMMTILAIAMIAVAITIGGQLKKPFDEVLMGIFICWTPQAVIGIIGLLGYLLTKHWKVEAPTET